jgi:hypothetical protein
LIEKKSRSHWRGFPRVINQGPAKIPVDDLFSAQNPLLKKPVNKKIPLKT